MPAHTWDDLYKALKREDLASSYYLFGVESVLKDEAMKAVLDHALEPSLRDFNLDQRSAGQLDADDVHTLCNTLPMMADRRIVLIRDVEVWSKKARTKAAILRYLERPSPTTILILVQTETETEGDADLIRSCYAVRLDPLPPERAARWLTHRASALGIEFTSEASAHLVLAADGSLTTIAAEIGKLSGLAGDAPITVTQVENLLGVRHGETQYDWRDAVLEGQAARGAMLLPEVLNQAGVSGVRLITLLGTALIGIGVARASYDRGIRGRALESAMFETIRRTRLWGLDYKATAAAWSRWAERWSAARVKNGLEATLAADRALKSTTISDDVGILTDLGVQLALHHQEAA